MSKEQFEKLQQGLDALTTQFKAAFPDDKAPADDKKKAVDKGDQSQDFTQLSEQIKAFSDRLDKLEGKKPEADTADKSTVPAEEFNALKTALEKLTEDFKAAVGEKPGTNSGEHVSNEEDLSKFV